MSLSKVFVGQVALVVHPYKLEPKSRFTPGVMSLDGKPVNVKVTGVGHAKFPAYTYWLDSAGKLFYVQGNFIGASLTSTPVDPAKSKSK